mmetsp:Transcript_25482/g.56052  ORF Transcript_25482/g.56052 Transcript_25482/m.56052 type:complete len:85 (-) Transcript_25482:491-745(-)
MYNLWFMKLLVNLERNQERNSNTRRTAWCRKPKFTARTTSKTRQIEGTRTTHDTTAFAEVPGWHSHRIVAIKVRSLKLTTPDEL